MCMKNSLKNKLITGTAIAGFGLASLVGPMNNYARAEEKQTMTGDMVNIIEEFPPTGVPIKILRGIFGGGKKETHIHVHQEKERNNYQQQRYQEPVKSDYERYQELPLIFTCTGGINTGGNYKGIGTKVITSEQDEYYIVAKAEVFKQGNEITNVDKCLTTGEEFKPHKITGRRENDNRTHLCTFYTKGDIEYARKKSHSALLWKNTWYADGREIGSVTYTFVDIEMLAKQQKLKSANENQSQ